MNMVENLAGRWTERLEPDAQQEVPAPRLCEAALPSLCPRAAGGDFAHPPPARRHCQQANATPPESPPLMGKLRHGEEK